MSEKRTPSIGGKTALLITTSMARDINNEAFNTKYIGGKAIFSKHHGGKVQKLKTSIPAKIEKVKPDIVVFQAGGNDISNITRLVDPITPIGLANSIIEVGKLCAKSGAVVAISSILPRQDFHHQVYRAEVNILLRGLCKLHNFIFIENSNLILSKHILADGVHFNKDGTNLFSNNLIDFLNEMSS